MENATAAVRDVSHSLTAADPMENATAAVRGALLTRQRAEDAEVVGPGEGGELGRLPPNRRDGELRPCSQSMHQLWTATDGTGLNRLRPRPRELEKSYRPRSGRLRHSLCRNYRLPPMVMAPNHLAQLPLALALGYSPCTNHGLPPMANGPEITCSIARMVAFRSWLPCSATSPKYSPCTAVFTRQRAAATAVFTCHCVGPGPSAGPKR